MDMGRISAVTLKLVKDLIGPTYHELNWRPEDVDLFIPHQVGRAAIFEGFRYCRGPEREIDSYIYQTRQPGICHGAGMLRQDEAAGEIVARFEDVNGEFR